LQILPENTSADNFPRNGGDTRAIADLKADIVAPPALWQDKRVSPAGHHSLLDIVPAPDEPSSPTAE
jgi:hypothetical protein